MFTLNALAGLAAATPPAVPPNAGQAASLSRVEQAAALSLAARSQAKQGNFRHCAALYLEAFELDPATPGYLFSAARCEQKAGDLKSALDHYDLVATRLPAGDPLVAKATTYREETARELQRREAEAAATRQASERAAREAAAREAAAREAAAREAAAREAAARSAPVPPSRAPADGSDQRVVKRAQPAPAMSEQEVSRRRWGWVAVAAGVVGVGVGSYALFDGVRQRSALQTDLAASAKAAPDGKVHDIGRDAAVAREREANVSVGIGMAAAGVGLVSGGVAAWLLLSPAGERLTLRPLRGLRGAELTMRF